jgi:alanyl-tRNA synthetase
VVVTLSASGEKVAAVAAVNDTAIAAGVQAREVLSATLPAIDGRGGGKGDVAQGGGSDAAGIDKALEAARSALSER